MNYLEFIAIMRTWYPKVIIKTDQNNNNNDNRRPITLSAPGNPSNLAPLPIKATNDILTKDDLSNVYAWLIKYSSAIDDTMGPEGLIALGLGTIQYDDTQSDLLPDGYTVIKDNSGARTIFNAAGQNIGSLDADATLNEKTTMIIEDLAGGVATNVIAGNTNNTSPSRDDLETTASISDNDIAAAMKVLGSPPGMGPLTDKQAQALQSVPLMQLFSTVTDILASKNFLDKVRGGISPVQIDKACKDKGFAFFYINADGQSSSPGYYILDKDKNLIAAGSLSRNRATGTYYMTDAAVQNLREQIKETSLKAPIGAAISPEQSDRVNSAESNSKSFLAERKNGPGKPGKGPEPEKKGPDGNGQDGHGN